MAQDVTPLAPSWCWRPMQEPKTWGQSRLGLTKALEVLVTSLRGDAVGDLRVAVLEQGFVLE